LRAVAAYVVSSAAAGLFITAVQFGSGAFPVLRFLRILIAPGYLLAAMFFPEGIHSDVPNEFLVLILVFSGLIYGFPLFFLWRWRSKSNRGR